MILERSMHPSWLSNSYLVGDEPGGVGVMIDAGGPVQPLVDAAHRHGLRVTHLLLTHHHPDHVMELDLLRDAFRCPVVGHPDEPLEGVDIPWVDGVTLSTGGLDVRALHTPGHTRGMLAFLVNETEVFTGDTLFRRTVGGTRAPGHATFDDLKRSILEVLLALPGETRVHPGHTDPTTIAEESEHNPFIRLWRGLDPPADEPCLAGGQPATLMLRARDYDGGSKCQVRFDSDGAIEVVAGSRVTAC